MKINNFLLFFLFCSIFPIHALALTCSYKGTDIIFVNGVNWSPRAVNDILKFDLKPYVKLSDIDDKAPAGKFVSFKVSYNSARGLVEDMIESYAQKIKLSFGVSENISFVHAYFSLQKTPLNPSFINSIVEISNLNFSASLSYLNQAFDLVEYNEMIKREYNVLLEDTSELKSTISETLLSRKKLVLISESQGNLFVGIAVNAFLSGEQLIYDLNDDNVLQSNEIGDYQFF